MLINRPRLNDLGQAVGGIPTSSLPHASHAFLYDHGVITDLGALDPTVDHSGARDINHLGQIVGYAGALLPTGFTATTASCTTPPPAAWST